MMQVSVDNIWASRSVLHMRVHVFVEGRWRHKYDVAVPITEIPEEALSAAWVPRDGARGWVDVPLFDR